MPTIADRPLSQDGKSGRWPAAMIAPTIIAIPVWLGPVWLGACALMQDWTPPATAGTNPPTVEPAPSPIKSAPIASGPIVLAPSMTGAPAPPPAAATATATPVPPPAIPVVMPAPAPAPAAAVDTPTFAPVSCPPGAVAMWSGPDAAGVPVPICRRLQPQR